MLLAAAHPVLDGRPQFQPKPCLGAFRGWTKQRQSPIDRRNQTCNGRLPTPPMIQGSSAKAGCKARGSCPNRAITPFVKNDESSHGRHQQGGAGVTKADRDTIAPAQIAQAENAPRAPQRSSARCSHCRARGHITAPKSRGPFEGNSQSPETAKVQCETKRDRRTIAETGPNKCAYEHRAARDGLASDLHCTGP